ncbi:hypothetical protein [Pilimelia columellifera]
MNKRREHYRADRAAGAQAGVAWRRATHRATVPVWAAGLESADGRWSGQVDGWQVTVTASVEECPDVSWLGEFTDDPHGAVPNPAYQCGRFRYFRPERTPSRAALWNAGVPRRDLTRVLHEQAADDARLALDDQFLIRVQVSRDGGPSGDAVLGGAFLEWSNDPLWLVDEHNLLAEAMRDAHGAQARLTRLYGYPPARPAPRRATNDDEARPCHRDGTPDSRYTVTPEWCGHRDRVDGLAVGQAWVARWCGTWLTAADTPAAGWAACRGHQNQRRKSRPVGSGRFVGYFGYAYRTADGWTGATLANCPTVEFVNASSLTAARQLARRMVGVAVGDVIHTGRQVRTVTELLVSVYEVHP